MGKSKMKITNYNERLNWTFDKKISYANEKIKEWYEFWDGNVHVMFSGGKDSTVLIDMVRKIYPDIPGVFCNTGLEFPEIINHVKTFSNIKWLKPDKSFYNVIKEDGYPVISKQQAEYIEQVNNNYNKLCSQVVRLRLTGLTKNNDYCQQFKISNKWTFLIDAPFKISAKCCKILKKRPANKYQKLTKSMPYIGTLSSESQIRKYSYVTTGCNAYKIEKPRSTPIAIFTEDDIYKYIKSNNLKISDIYKKGYKSTGCIFCLFGIHIEQKKTGTNRIIRLKETHPKLYEYCINKLNIKEVMNYINVPYE